MTPKGTFYVSFINQSIYIQNVFYDNEYRLN